MARRGRPCEARRSGRVSREKPGRDTVIVAANWKMNPGLAEAERLAAAYAKASYANVTRIVFPPAPYVMRVREILKGSDVRVGAQDSHHEPGGAHTGDVSATIMADCGATIALLGHSERRRNHAEGSDLVRAKAIAALAAGLDVMVCVGETLEQRRAGKQDEVVLCQIDESLPDGIDADRLVIAYEPVWAIGTGMVAEAADVASMHTAIAKDIERRGLGGAPVLYGGSVKPDNAGELVACEGVGGFLVGGASLKANDFAAICAAADQ